MRLKSFDRTAVLAWCPVVPYSHYVVAGSIVGSLGDDFSASSKLEIFSTKKQENGDVMGSVDCPDRFSQLAWSSNVQNSERGMVAGAMVDGSIGIWNMDKVFESNTEEACVATLEKHGASVKGLEFNPKQSQLLASAGEDGQLYIWNLKQLEQPTLYSLGGKNPHANQVISHLAWNYQIETLLATTSHSGLTVVWDLKQKRPLVPITNSSHKKRYSAVSWNPEVPLQLAVASEDDEVPVIEIWDIRQAFAPLKELKGHTKGCLSLNWCPDDGNLLMSSGRDNRTLFWNPSSGDLLGELPLANSWVFDAKWSPRPSVLSTCSFDGKISIYSLQEFNEQASDNSVQLTSANASLFKTAPKWMKRPAGASFGFGNRLVSFSQKGGKTVRLDQVYRDEAFAKEANQLENTLQQRNFEQFCQQKAAGAEEKGNSQEALLWHVLQSCFVANVKQKQTILLQALGFQNQLLQDRVAKQADLQEENKDKIITIMDPSVVDDLLKEALILSNFELAVQICLQANRMDDALMLAASHGNADLWQKTREAYFAKQTERPVMKQLALLLNGRNLAQMVEQTLSLENWRDVLAMVVAHGKDAAEWKVLIESITQQLSSAEGDDKELALTVCSILSGNVQPLIQFWFQQLPEQVDIDDANEGLVIVEWIQKSIIIQEWNQITHPNTQVELPAAIQGYIQQYARKLSEHGLLNSSLRYYNSVLHLMQEKADETVLNERFRIYYAVSAPSGPQPTAPFVVKPILQAKKPQVQQPMRQQVPQQQQQSYYPQQTPFVPQQQQMLPNQQHPSIYPTAVNHPSPYLSQVQQQPQLQQQQPYLPQATASAPYMPTAPQLPQQQVSQQGTPYMPQVQQPQPTQILTPTTASAPKVSPTSTTPTTTAPSSNIPSDASLSQMDISKVNQKYQRIVQVLLKFFEATFNDPNAPATLQPKKRIIQNDLKFLFQALNENHLHDRVCDELMKLADAIENRNNHDLDAVIVKLSNDYWNESKGFIKGLKFIQSILK